MCNVFQVELRCGKSSTSDAFSLNTAGSAGQLSCKQGNYKMEVSTACIALLTDNAYFKVENNSLELTRIFKENIKTKCEREKKV